MEKQRKTQAQRPKNDRKRAPRGLRRGPQDALEWLIAVGIAGVLGFGMVQGCKRDRPEGVFGEKSAGGDTECRFLERGKLCFFICEHPNGIDLEEVDCAKVPVEEPTP